MSDPFARIRELSRSKRDVTHEWVQELKALRAAGFSVRAIAQAANVSHDTVWRQAT